jgi:hypothetical protein
MKKEYNTKPFEFKFNKTQTENDLKEYILGTTFTFHSWAKKTRNTQETVTWRERPQDSLSPICSEVEYYEVGYYECKRCKLIEKETRIRFNSCLSKMRPPKKDKSCNIPYPGFTRKKLFEKLKIELKEHLEEKKNLFKNLPQLTRKQLREAIIKSMKNFSLFPGFSKLNSEEKKQNKKDCYWFTKEHEISEDKPKVAICSRCFFVGGELTGLNPDLIPIKKEWGISFAACELCKGNTWIDGNVSNFYNSKFDESGHLKEWAKIFLAYDEIIKISKTRDWNKEFYKTYNDDKK